jgi:hypothetical protein
MINIDAASTISSAKKLITPERNALSDTTIETTECLKGLVGLFRSIATRDGSDVESFDST